VWTGLLEVIKRVHRRFARINCAAINEATWKPWKGNGNDSPKVGGEYHPKPRPSSPDTTPSGNFGEIILAGNLFLAFVVDYEGEITNSLELHNNICLFDFISHVLFLGSSVL